MPANFPPDDPQLISNCQILLALCRNIGAARAELKDAMGQRHLEVEKELRELSRRYGQINGALQSTFEEWILNAVADHKRIFKEFAPYMDEEDLLQEVRIRMWKNPPNAEPTSEPVARVRRWIKTVVINYLLDVLDRNARMVVCNDEHELEKPNDSESFDTVRPEDKRRVRREMLVLTLSMQHPGNEAEENWDHRMEESEEHLQARQQETELDLAKKQVFDAFDYYLRKVWPTIMSPEHYKVLLMDYEFIQREKTQFATEVAERLGITVDNYYKRRERYREALCIWWLQSSRE